MLPRSQLLLYLEDITQALATYTTSEAGLANGHAGLALFYDTLCQSSLVSSTAREAREFHFDRTQELLASQELNASLWEGFAGVAWLFAICEDPSLVEELDALVLAFVTQDEPWQGELDLIWGLVGAGVYGLARAPKAIAFLIMQQVLAQLATLAEHCSEGTRWKIGKDLAISAALGQPEGHYNLGLAHGHAGIVAMLGRFCKHPELRGLALPLLEGAVNYLLAQENPTQACRFPAYCPVRPVTETIISRNAWCYGLPGHAVALWQAGEGAGVLAWKETSRRLARAAAALSLEDGGIRDAGLCHGTAGLSFILRRLGKLSGETDLLHAADQWLATSTQFYRPDMLGGFPAMRRIEEETRFVPSGDLLNGSAGVALSLLAALEEPNVPWYEPFLIP